MDLNPEVEQQVRHKVPWSQVPAKVKEIFGNSHKGYDRAVLAYSIRNQLRYSENLVKFIQKDEGKYYEDLVAYSKDHLMLYPYHLSDRVVRGLRITPFQYYISILEKIMDQEKSYDSLPNFTAADCLRLLGIGRNQYIELMNQHRSSRKLFRKNRPCRELLPAKPIDVSIEPWFIVHCGHIVEDDIAQARPAERKLIDYIIDSGPQAAGSLDFDCVHSLHLKGLVYLDAPVESEDFIVVPPLEGFVMNRVLGDYFETLLYKIFVSIDEHTSVGELAGVLDIDTELIQNAVSLYCRLGFAYKKNTEIDLSTLDPSWKKYQPTFTSKTRVAYQAPDESLIEDELSSALRESDSTSSLSDMVGQLSVRSFDAAGLSPPAPSTETSFLLTSSQSMSGISRRIAFLYDSTLTAFLMMGNLSPGLKNHAVTMFEVGKMADESLDIFLTELEQIAWNEGEGEALRYFEHAKTLRKTILFFRNNPDLGPMCIDLLRCESLQNLDRLTCSRLLNKNYSVLVSMAPLSYEVVPICSETLAHFGPAIPQVNSIWFKLFLYHITNSGPSSLLLSRGTVLSELPSELEECQRYLVTSWGHDPSVIPGINALFTINDALCHSAVLIQTYGSGSKSESSIVIVPFPFSTAQHDSSKSHAFSKWTKHPAILRLGRLIDLESNCGFITMINVRRSSTLPVLTGDNEVVVVGAQDTSECPKQSIQDNETYLQAKSVVDNASPLIILPSDPVESVPQPTNGFKDDNCAKLYLDELESVVDSSASQSSVEDSSKHRKPKVFDFDPRQQQIETLRLDLGQASGSPSCEPKRYHLGSGDSESSGSCWFDDWTLLDCQFGIPLFDSDVNQLICERIVSNDLLAETSLENLIRSNEELGKQLTEFIHTYQKTSSWNEEIPLPSKNFLCHNGLIQEFDPFEN